MDNDAIVLKDAAAVVLSIDLKYRRANFNTKRKLKTKRDKAFVAYTKARRKLLEEGVLCTKDDVKKMAEIRKEVARARQTQSLIIAVGRVVAFLVKIAA